MVVRRNDDGARSPETAFREALQLAAALLGRGDVAQAQHSVQRAIQLRPGDPNAQNLIALVFYYQGSYELAYELLDLLVRRSPDAAALRLNAGLAALQSGHLEQALSHLQRAIDLDPSRRRAFVYLALVHVLMKDRDLAAAALLEAGLQARAEQVGKYPAQGDQHDIVAQLWRDAADMPANDLPWPPTQGGYLEIVTPEVQRSAAGNFRSGQPIEAWSGGLSATGRQAPVGNGVQQDDRRAQTPTVSEGPVGQAVQIDSTRVRIHVGSWGDQTAGQGAVVRVDRLVSVQGNLDIATVWRRRKAEQTDLFVVEGAEFCRASGNGMILLQGERNEQVEVISLGPGDVLSVRESAIIAFSSVLHAENGQIPGGPSLVRLAGEGFAVVKSSRKMCVHRLGQDAPLFVRPGALVGWLGDVVVLPESVAGDAAWSGYLYCEGLGTAFVQ